MSKISLKSLSKHFDLQRKNEFKDSAILSNKTLDYENRIKEDDVLFVLNAFMKLPSIQVSPSVDEIQLMLTTAGKIMISVAKGVGQWKHMKKKEGNTNMFSFVQQSQGIIVKKIVKENLFV